MIPKEQKVKR